jgi:cytidylate kinase
MTRGGGTIVTIDGPAGTGKSSVAKRVAGELGFDFLDTGAMYRAIGLEAHRRNADLDDPRELGFIAGHCRIEFDWTKDPPALVLNGEDVSRLLRSGDATAAASRVATVGAIRERLVEQQRQIGREHAARAGLVTEGRDQGSVVFPEAAVKVFLTADPSVRAQRRAKQLRDRGEIVDDRAILEEMLERDERDRNRPIAPLVRPADAAEIDTTGMDEDQVVGAIVELVRS